MEENNLKAISTVFTFDAQKLAVRDGSELDEGLLHWPDDLLSLCNLGKSLCPGCVLHLLWKDGQGRTRISIFVESNQL